MIVSYAMWDYQIQFELKLVPTINSLLIFKEE
jgi:hypothetical protein